MWNAEEIKNWNEDNFKMFEGKKYNISDLEFMLNHSQVSLKSILMTQSLTVDFCKKYLLNNNNKYSIKEGDKNLTIDDIIYYQNHLNINDF